MKSSLLPSRSTLQRPLLWWPSQARLPSEAALALDLGVLQHSQHRRQAPLAEDHRSSTTHPWHRRHISPPTFAPPSSPRSEPPVRPPRNGSYYSLLDYINVSFGTLLLLQMPCLKISSVFLFLHSKFRSFAIPTNSFNPLFWWESLWHVVMERCQETSSYEILLIHFNTNCVKLEI